MSKTTLKNAARFIRVNQPKKAWIWSSAALIPNGEACESYIASQKHEDWFQLPDNDDEGGFTGGNMDRPDLKRLMDDIKSGLIDTVVVVQG
ncbi:MULTISPECIES: hypothetical protein [unclassified Bartonella]|uniref:hypothetical protein n=1 Tax=unclassified Bartonella TaxID=2645622 RepID=UPI0035D052BC